jgi:hypothetical protein
MKFHVGHIAYPDNSVNRFACLNTIQGVYAELWERGVHPRECDRVCRELSSSVFTNTTSTTVWADREVIEAHRIMSDIEIVVARGRVQERRQVVIADGNRPEDASGAVGMMGRRWSAEGGV